MAEEEKSSPLDDLQRKLYTPGGTPEFREPELTRRAAPQAAGWAGMPPPLEPKKKLPLSTLVLICGGAFFLIALGTSALLLFLGTRALSTDNAIVAVAGPTTIASGDTVQLIVTVENKNPAPMTDTELSVDYPDGTFTADTQQPYPRYDDTLGTLAPGSSETRTATAIVTGGANQTVTLPVTFQYKTQGSNAVFVKKQQYTFTITSSPIAVSVDSLSQNAAGQPMTLSVHVRSNATAPLQNIALLAAYPPGFNKTTTNPAPSSSANTSDGASDTFLIGTLAPGDTKTITVSGSLTGQEGDVRAFHFSAGTQNTSGALTLTYSSQESDVTVTKPFLAVSLALNHADADTVIVKSGMPIEGLLSWANALTTPIENAQIGVHISGSGLDTSSVSTQNGFYRSSDSTLIWSGQTTAGLAQLAAGDSGAGTFNFMSKSGAALAGTQQPVINLSISVAGQRVGESGVPQTVTSTITKQVKVATDLTIASRAVRSVGPFKNTGPWPPVANQESTYSILLSAANTTNAVAGTAVTMSLPSYVRFTNTTDPADGSIVYDDANRTVTWNVGPMQPGATNQAAFQVALLPSSTQKSTSPVLVFQQTITGTDQFTGASVLGTAGPLTIQLQTDPAYNPNLGVVTQ
jgi:hypothetical protein